MSDAVMFSLTALAVSVLALLLGLGLSARLRQLEAEIEEARAPTRLSGLAVGTIAPVVDTVDAAGNPVDWERVTAGPTLATFVSPGCEPCEALREALPKFHRSRPEWHVVVVSAGEPEAAVSKFGDAAAASGGLLLVDRHGEIARKFENVATPFAFAIRDRKIAAAGVVGNAETLERLADGRASPTPGAALTTEGAVPVGSQSS